MYAPISRTSSSACGELMIYPRCPRLLLTVGFADAISELGLDLLGVPRLTLTGIQLLDCGASRPDPAASPPLPAAAAPPPPSPPPWRHGTGRHAQISPLRAAACGHGIAPAVREFTPTRTPVSVTPPPSRPNALRSRLPKGSEYSVGRDAFGSLSSPGRGSGCLPGIRHE